MKKQINYWKIATLILGLFFVMIIFTEIKTAIEIRKTPEEFYSLGKFDIPKDDFDYLIEINKDKTSFPICSIKENKCVIINKIG